MSLPSDVIRCVPSPQTIECCGALVCAAVVRPAESPVRRIPHFRRRSDRDNRLWNAAVSAEFSPQSMLESVARHICSSLLPASSPRHSSETGSSCRATGPVRFAGAMPCYHLVIAGACHLTKSAAPLLSRRLPSLFPQCSCRHGPRAMLCRMGDREGRERGAMAGERPLSMLVKTTRRAAVALSMAIGVGLLMSFTWAGALSALFVRTIILGLSATAVFTVFEAWPRSLPRWLQRWVLQVLAVGVCIPVTTSLIYVLGTPQGASPFWENPSRWSGWSHLTIAGVLLAPWAALAAIVRRRTHLRAIKSWRSHSREVSSSGRRSTRGRWSLRREQSR